MPPRDYMPPFPLNLLTYGEVWRDWQAENWLKDQDPDQGDSRFSLALARVTRVDYSLHTVTLMMISGTKKTELRTPVPISYPGAGARHFLGAVPTVGSFCVVGLLPTKPTHTPVVLAWNIPNPWMGHDWIPTQDFHPTEFDLTFRKQTELEGISHRVRHKLRHMYPGNICASSDQGADLVLDEGVLVCDRRGDEFRIREQDGSFIFRSQQQFHAAGGMRQYTGMVQRDASFLPIPMVSDGRRWDGPKVTSNGLPSAPFQLDEDLLRKAMQIQPHDAFKRVQVGGVDPDSGYRIQPSLDPYRFLRNGLFIAEDGQVINPDLTLADAEYAGKSIFRVSAGDNPDSGDGQPANAAVDADEKTLVEHRVEIDHTWDGRLPVTEQTGGFDADRLPPAPGDGSPLSAGERRSLNGCLEA